MQTCATYLASGREAKLLCESKGVSIVDKIKIITAKIYGASDVSNFSRLVILEKITMLETSGHDGLPECIAKTSVLDLE